MDLNYELLHMYYIYKYHIIKIMVTMRLFIILVVVRKIEKLHEIIIFFK